VEGGGYYRTGDVLNCRIGYPRSLPFIGLICCIR
jgi:hypothetical protein